MKRKLYIDKPNKLSNVENTHETMFLTHSTKSLIFGWIYKCFVLCMFEEIILTSFVFDDPTNAAWVVIYPTNACIGVVIGPKNKTKHAFLLESIRSQWYRKINAFNFLTDTRERSNQSLLQRGGLADFWTNLIKTLMTERGGGAR